MSRRVDGLLLYRSETVEMVFDTCCNDDCSCVRQLDDVMGRDGRNCLGIVQRFNDQPCAFT